MAVPSRRAGGRECQLLPLTTCGPRWDDVLRDAWLEAVTAGYAMVEIFCSGCRGTVRAHLGTVFVARVGPLLEMELVVPHSPGVTDLGAGRRGEPNAPQRILALNEPWPDEDPIPFFYCRRDGRRHATFGEIRSAYGRAFDEGGETQHIGI